MSDRAGLVALLDDAAERYREHPRAAERLREQARRLDEPLRVALVGRVKAGKSTLLNALVGARVAATDAGECTLVLTEYRHGQTPRATAHDRLPGGPRALRVHRVVGGLQLHLGAPPQEVSRVVVEWPAPFLSTATVIDTPGLSSLTRAAGERTQAFVDEEDLPGPDVVVFLTRQMQPEDVAFLAAFQARTGAGTGHTTTVTVLSRADEIAAGGLDAMQAAADVARRMSADPAIRGVSSRVLPVSGLLALGARLLRHGDFLALRSLATADPGAVERLLLTADRFVREDAPVPVAASVRAALLEKFGLFGIRLSLVLIRSGVSDGQLLAEELGKHSGLATLEQVLTEQFTRNGDALKTGTALRAIEEVLRGTPVPGSERLWAELERIRLGAHDLAELELLGRLRTAEDLLPPVLRAEGEQLLGATGRAAAARLGLPAEAGGPEVRAAAVAVLARWRAEAADPRVARRQRDAITLVLRSVEEVLADLDGERSAGGLAQEAQR